MSLKAILDIVVHFESFKNVDLYHFGVYAVRATIYQLDKTQTRTNFAVPYTITNAHKDRDNSYLLGPAKLNEESLSFTSKEIILKYQKDDYEVNDIFHLKMEIDAYPFINDENIFLECELLHCPLNNSGKNKNSGFECAARYKAKLNKLHMGIREFFPVFFDEHHLCAVNASIHSFLLDFKYKSEQNVLFENKNKVKTSKTFLEFLTNTSQNQKDFLNYFYFLYINLMKGNYEKQRDENSRMIKLYASKINCLDHYNASILYKPIPNLPESRYSNPKFNKDELLQERISKKPQSLREISPIKIASAMNKENIRITKKHSFYDTKPSTNTLTESKFEEIQAIGEIFLEEMNLIAGLLFQLWQKYIEILKFATFEITSSLMKNYNVKLKSKFSQSVFCEQIKTNDLSCFIDSKVGPAHKELADELRGRVSYSHKESLNVEEVNFFPKPILHPIIFEEIFVKESKENHLWVPTKPRIYDYSKVHLFVLAHGFRGNQFDLRMLKGVLSYKYPHSIFVSSSSNEDSTDGDIEQMGRNLSREVISFLETGENEKLVGRISFIGYSLGGVIIRAALPYLEQFSDKFFSYVSLASPHLGYLFGSSSLIDAGMWVMKKWMNNRCIKQLSLKDGKEIEECFMYQLSKKRGLNHFNNVAVVSSYQDEYVPYESARIQKCKESLNSESKLKGKKYQEMAENILQNLREGRIHRIDVNFNINEKNIDSLIGRAAHMKFIDSEIFLHMFLTLFNSFFE